MNSHEVLPIQFTKATIIRLGDELKQARKLKNFTLFEIATVLLAWGRDRRPPATIAAVLGLKVTQVRRWIDRFSCGQFHWLANYHFKNSYRAGKGRRRPSGRSRGKQGRPSRLSEEEKARLTEVIVQGPLAYGFECGGWNAALINCVIKEQFGKRFNVKYIPQLLRAMNLSYQKAKFVAAKALDDEKLIEERATWDRQRWPEIVRRAKAEGAVILFGDEVGFAQWGSLSYTWALRGQQPLIKTCGQRKKLKVFGAIAFLSGKLHYQECRGQFNGESYIRFLKQLLRYYKGQKVVLIEDGAPYHNPKKVKAFVEEHSELIEIERLPAYSPEKNPIERLWRKVKREGTHLKYFPTFEDLRNSVLKVFKRFQRNARCVREVMGQLLKKWGFEPSASQASS